MSCKSCVFPFHLDVIARLLDLVYYFLFLSKDIKVTPWQPIVTEPGEAKPRRRCITWAIQQYGSSPNCRNCSADGGAHSEICRLPFEKIWDKGVGERIARLGW